MRHSLHTSRRKSPLLTLLALWAFCWMVGGMAHLGCHLEENARLPQPAAPHPCSICQSLAQNGRSDIFTQTRKSVQPVFDIHFLSQTSQVRPAAQRAMISLVPNRGPPTLLRI